MKQSTRNRLDRVNRQLMELSAHVLANEPGGENFSDEIERIREELREAESDWFSEQHARAAA